MESNSSLDPYDSLNLIHISCAVLQGSIRRRELGVRPNLNSVTPGNFSSFTIHPAVFTIHLSAICNSQLFNDRNIIKS